MTYASAKVGSTQFLFPRFSLSLIYFSRVATYVSIQLRNAALFESGIPSGRKYVWYLPTLSSNNSIMMIPIT